MAKSSEKLFGNIEREAIGLTDKVHEKRHRRKNAGFGRTGNSITVCAIGITIICVIFCIYYWSKAITVGVDAMTEAYNSVKDARVEEVRQELREKGFAKGEEEYHTSNRITIRMNDVQEIAALEVMKVSDVVYVIQDEKTHEWLKASGTGVYTVNMAAGEYLIDDELQYVFVRVPKPELTVNMDSPELIFFKDDRIISNGSISDGEEEARRQRAEAQIKLTEDIESNQTFHQQAEESAKSLIKSLVRSFNSDISELEVDVDFFN